MENKRPTILVFNGGSSSLKLGLFDSADLKELFRGSGKGIGTDKGLLEIKNTENQPVWSENGLNSNRAAVNAVGDWLRSIGVTISAIGHRLVHAGKDHCAPEAASEPLLRELDAFSDLDPEHLPGELELIRLCTDAFHGVPQFICYDTWFHRELPEVARSYPLPEKYQQHGLRKYGFHGISCEYILHQLKQTPAAVERQKIIIAHLGSGASMTAVLNGKSFDTTMGLTPTGGLVMGNRTGDLDPGVLLFLLKKEGLSPDELGKLLNEDAGLKALAGTGDIEQLLKQEQQNEQAATALALFCYSARKFIGALAAAMGGLDLLVFTGGIAEHSEVIRNRICSRLEFMKNFDIQTIPTNEEWMIASHVQTLMQRS